MSNEVPAELLPLFQDSNGKFIPDLWWFSFDSFLVPLVALAARKMREDGHGYPGNETEESWHAYLKQIEDDLSGYDKFAYSVADGHEDYERVKDALRRFVDRLADWWD